MSSDEHNCTGRRLAFLALGALGVVYGDIGTSPLYAIKESFLPGHGIPFTPHNILGILSLVFWALAISVTIKYLSVIFRADNKGEGGIMALLALLMPHLKNNTGVTSHSKTIIIFLGLIGTGLLYGDGVITPAITTLSALEGLEIATPAFKPYIVPATILILIGLFALQKKGTASIGAVFGPTMLVWFAAIAALGIPWIVRNPHVLTAVNPVYAVRFFIENGTRSFFILGSIVLVITGGEALYADMGHFGKRPIRLGWYTIVFPALLCNYFGQGALILEKGADAIANPFYGIVPPDLLYPMVILATLAAIIASQSLISGAFSLTQQAASLGYLPRITILHTSRWHEGQIFVPKVNTLLMIGCVALVFAFRESTNLAAAYGIAVTGTMFITSILYFFVARNIWKWSFLGAVALLTLFLLVDSAFLAANSVKILHGGWIPLLIAGGILLIMTTWKKGREHLSRTAIDRALPLNDFFAQLDQEKPPRVRGTAVFMTLNRDIAPTVLLHHYRHNQSLHEKVVLLSVLTENVPDIPATERVRATELTHGFIKIVARYGYMEAPDIKEVLEHAEGAGLHIDHSRLSYFLGREAIKTTGTARMLLWRKRLFVFMSRNARTPTEFFNLPPDKVVELGSQMSL